MEPQDLESKIDALSDRLDELANSVQQRLNALEQQAETDVATQSSPTNSEAISAPAPAPTSGAVPGQTPPFAPQYATYPAQQPAQYAQQPLGQQPPPPQLLNDLTSQYPTLAAQKQSGQGFQLNTETLLRWVGVGLVTLAAIFLVSTAIARNWISEEVQLAMAGLLGAVMLFSTFVLIPNRKPWANWIGGAGAIILLSASVSTYSWLELVSPDVATAIGLAATGLAVIVALATKLDGVSATTFAVTLYILLFALRDSDQFVTITAVIILGLLVFALAVAVSQGWKATWLAGVITTVLAIPLLAAVESEDVFFETGLVVVIIAGLAIWVSALIFPTEVKETSSSPKTLSHSDYESLQARAVGLIPIWAAFTLNIPSDGPRASVIFITVALVTLGFGIGAMAIKKTLIGVSTLFGALSSLAVGFLFLFDGVNAVVPLLLHAAAAAVIGYRFKDILNQMLAAITAAVATLIGLGVILAHLEDGFNSLGDWIAGTAILLAWAGAAVAASMFKDRLPKDVASLPILGSWAILLAWVVTAVAGFNGQLALVTIIWGLIAVIAIIVGLAKNHDTVRYLGIATLFITIAKMLIIDLQGVDVFVRVVIFFVFGVALIAVGLAVPKLVKGEKQP